jgi:hypothetical protein
MSLCNEKQPPNEEYVPQEAETTLELIRKDDFFKLMEWCRRNGFDVSFRDEDGHILVCGKVEIMANEAKVYFGKVVHE